MAIIILLPIVYSSGDIVTFASLICMKNGHINVPIERTLCTHYYTSKVYKYR